MKSTTKHTPQSSPISTGVYDIDTLQTECEVVGVEPTRENIRRMRRAIDLHEAGAVKPFAAPAVGFFVKSQTDPHELYIVLEHTGCSCPDAKRMNAQFELYTTRIHESTIRCKHELATMLFEEQRRDQAMCDEHDALEAASDDWLEHYDPDADFPY